MLTNEGSAAIAPQSACDKLVFDGADIVLQDLIRGGSWPCRQSDRYRKRTPYSLANSLFSEDVRRQLGKLSLCP
jgi:hypothetical protein